MASEIKRVERFVRNHPWAITQEKLDIICEIVARRSSGVTLTEAEIQAAIGAQAGQRQIALVNSVAVIPLCGVLAQKMNLMTQISGGTSMEQFIGQVRAKVADQTVKAIVIDADSPGGTVDGCIEAADALFALKGSKPIVAVANPLIASAAYWLLAQCDEVVSTPSGQVGSIGVFCVHADLSKQNDLVGVHPEYVYAGDFKVERNEDAPLSDEAKAFLQSQVNERYNEFIKAVARGRGITVATVKASFGQGRVLFANDAKAAGMIDRIETLERTVERLGAGASRRAFGAAAAGAATTIVAQDGAAAAEQVPADQPTVMDPDEQGFCPDGYEARDGMCYLLPPADDQDDEPDEDDQAKQAKARDHALIATVLGQD